MKKKFVEIRSMNLKNGTREEFHRRFLEKALPLLKKWNMDVVAFGPSLHDENSYYVIRAFESLDDRQVREDAYYGSTDWRLGPREEMLALIENYFDIVIEMKQETVNALRQT
jgi:hypothetical protein